MRGSVPRLLLVAGILLSLPLVAQAQSIYINCGSSSSYTDPSGITWQADKNFNTGVTGSVGSSVDISGTTKDPLYRSERYDVNGGPELKYDIPVPNGQYDVALHFAETYSGAFGAGKRVFDVKVEGLLKFNDLDIYAQAGNSGNRALVKTTTVTVNDGSLTIDFSRITENPTISGIQIEPSGGSSGGGSAIRINVGGGNYVDSQGNAWVKDDPYVNSGSNTFSTGSDISDTPDPNLFKVCRFVGNLLAIESLRAIAPYYIACLLLLF